MPNRFAQTEFPASQKVYAWLLRAYPPAHRVEYGAAMAQLFRDQCRDAWRDSGNWGLTKLWLRVLPDWASTSVRERLAALNERKTMNDKLASLARDRSTPSAIFIRVAVTVFLLTLIIATAVTYILPESYASTCKLMVENDQPDTSNATNSFGTQYDPYFIQTTFEIINSPLVLSNVIASLNLNVAWGKKYYNGETLKTTETMNILRGRMSLAPVQNTKLIAITVYSDDKNECALIANAVAEAYKDYRMKIHSDQTRRLLSALQTESSSLSNHIQATQQNIAELRAALDIHDDISALTPTATYDPSLIIKYHDEILEGERVYKDQFVQLENLKAMGKTNMTMLRDMLPAISPDSTLTDLLSQYRETQRSRQAKLVDYGTNHLEVQRIQTSIGQLDTQINERVAGTMAALEAQVSSKRASLDLLIQKVEEAKMFDAAKSDKTRPYYEAKAKLMELKRASESLDSKLSAARIETQLSRQLVQITDPGEPARWPVKPNKTLNIVLGGVAGIFLGMLAGGAAALAAARRGNRAPKTAASN